MTPTDPVPTLRLLLLDDEQLEAEALASLLRTCWEATYHEKLETAVFRRVSEGTGSREAISISALDEYDAVLLDVVYPDQPDGIQMAAIIRKWYRRLPVIVFSRNVTLERIPRLLEQQVAGYIRKTDDANEMCPHIRAAIQRHLGPELAWPLLDQVQEMAAGGDSWLGFPMWNAVHGFVAGSNSNERWRAFKGPWIVASTGCDMADMYADLTDLCESQELSMLASSSTMRGHLEHVVQVHLLGYLLSHRLVGFRKVVEEACQDFPPGVRQSPDNTWALFQNAWLLAALVHDVGYPAEVLPKTVSICRDIAKRFPAAQFSGSMPDNFVAEQWKPASIGPLMDSMKKVLQRLKGDHLHDLIWQSAKFTEGGVTYFNHGVASAIKFLETAQAKLPNKNRPEFLWFAQWAGLSMALHAMVRPFSDRYDVWAASTEPDKGPVPLGIELAKDPLSFLLTLCDELQDWNRERFDQQYDVDAQKIRRDLMSTRLKSIQVTGNTLQASVEYIAYPHLAWRDLQLFREQLTVFRSKRNLRLARFLKASPISVCVEFSLLGCGPLGAPLKLDEA